MSEEKKETKCCGCSSKDLSNEELDKVSGGAPEYQEGWEIDTTIDNIYCLTCNKNVTGVMYKQALARIYCPTCHNFLIAQIG